MNCMDHRIHKPDYYSDSTNHSSIGYLTIYDHKHIQVVFLLLL